MTNNYVITSIINGEKFEEIFENAKQAWAAFYKLSRLKKEVVLSHNELRLETETRAINYYRDNVLVSRLKDTNIFRGPAKVRKRKELFKKLTGQEISSLDELSFEIHNWIYPTGWWIGYKI